MQSWLSLSYLEKIFFSSRIALDKWANDHFTSGDSQRLFSIIADGLQLIFSDWILQTEVLGGCEGGSQYQTTWTKHLKYRVKFFLAVRAYRGTPCPLLKTTSTGQCYKAMIFIGLSCFLRQTTLFKTMQTSAHDYWFLANSLQSKKSSSKSCDV